MENELLLNARTRMITLEAEVFLHQNNYQLLIDRTRNCRGKLDRARSELAEAQRTFHELEMKISDRKTAKMVWKLLCLDCAWGRKRFYNSKKQALANATSHKTPKRRHRVRPKSLIVWLDTIEQQENNPGEPGHAPISQSPPPGPPLSH